MGVAEPLIQASLLGEAVDNAPAAIFVADEQGRYVAVNRFACDLLGYSREELLALNVRELSPDSPVDDLFAALSHSGRLDGTAVLLKKDGTPLTIQYRSSRTTVAGMEFFVSVAIPES